MSGISEPDERERDERGETGVMALLEWQSCVLCKLLGGDVSSEEFQPLPVITKQAFCLPLIDRFLATTSLFSLSDSERRRPCCATLKSS